ncbi:MAG: hypothetical protein EZS28_022377 [Streblomastix strix]|uniref:NrS-1 polymerase-like helicase domain-containing protein n=1 Tax=Streblomastix strix TaxID=222440 RepID=A0A5J4VI81_9EUKA|nr:MAG: hypothetical protein EZS28_022377 [Streblomastix strix]
MEHGFVPPLVYKVFELLSETKMATEEFSNDKSNQQTDLKYETLEKGPKRKYTRISKTDEKAKIIIDQMIIEQTNEQINEQTNEEKYDQRIHHLKNSEDNLETRFSNQQIAFRLQKNKDVNLFEEAMQPLVGLYMQEKDSKIIIERVKDAMINTVNYTKIGQQEDIHKDKLIEEIDKIRQNLIDILPPNVGLVKTAHGGLHIYCNGNLYLLPSNRNVKVAITDSFDICVFAQMTKYKIENGQETKEIIQNRVVALNTSIREIKTNQRVTPKYEAVNDWENSSHLASLREILDKWNIDIEMSYKDYAQQKHDRIFGVQINDDGAIEQMNDELAQTFVDGLKILEIHNYPQPINMKVSLLGIFCGLYGISDESIRAEGMTNICQFNKLTANADKNYGQAVSNGERKPNPWILTKILRYHNKDYDEQIIKPLLKKNQEVKKQSKIVVAVKQIEKHEIDLKDVFTLTDSAGKQIETAIILQGLQGIGKNVFTNVLCELLAGYTSKNITDIDDFVGKFNAAIENKMLAIANEMKNFGESRIDISQFNLRNIPMTYAKKEIIRASKLKVDDIIIDHFKQFKDDVIISQVQLQKPQDMLQLFSEDVESKGVAYRQQMHGIPVVEFYIFIRHEIVILQQCVRLLLSIIIKRYCKFVTFYSLSWHLFNNK